MIHAAKVRAAWGKMRQRNVSGSPSAWRLSTSGAERLWRRSLAINQGRRSAKGTLEFTA
jgi:hypothetical protein